MACFLALDVLRAQVGDDLPYDAVLSPGFNFRGSRVPFLNRQKGIYRAAVQRGPAALSIQTSAKSPYEDEVTGLGFLYDYRAGSIDQPDNRALRAAAVLRVPLVYFVGLRPGLYHAEYPCYVMEDRPDERRVLISSGRMAGPLDEPEPVVVEDPGRTSLRSARDSRSLASGSFPRAGGSRLRRALHDLSFAGGSAARRSAHRSRHSPRRIRRDPERPQSLQHPPSRVRRESCRNYAGLPGSCFASSPGR